LTPSPEELHQFIRTRQSVRRFTPAGVPRPVIERILETGARAPSAHNRQPWRFAVLTAAADKTRLADALAAELRRDLTADGVAPDIIEKDTARSRGRIIRAPLAIVLCLTMIEMDTYPDARRQRAEFRMALQSVALAGGQLLLAAHAEGLAGVWVCAPLFVPETVRDTLHLPGDWEPQGMLLIGYPASSPKERERKPIHEIAIFQ
jgi:F420 biosynthesis protein FbiB-like protein